MTFDQALRAARDQAAARGRVMQWAALAPAVLGLGAALATGRVVLFAVGALWGVDLFRRGGAQTDALDALRGITPSLWAPSPSHGFLALNGGLLLVGEAAFSIDRHDVRRVVSVSYDEATHAALVDTTRMETSRRGQEREVTERFVVRLDPHTTPAAGAALARSLRELNAR